MIFSSGSKDTLIADGVNNVRESIGSGYVASPWRFVGGAGATLRSIGLLVVALLVSLVFAGSAQAQAPVGLGTADSFGVLGASTVTNTGPTVINGDLGVSPGNAVVGFPPGIVNGTIHSGNAVAAQAQSDLTAAYNDAAGRACNVILTGQNLGGLTLTSGVYCFATSAQLTGDLTLDAQGDPNAVFIFQIGSTLTTASSSSVNLINASQSCNVFWQIGSSATLGTTTTFVGNVLALETITATTGATVDGRLLARTGAVTLDTNTVTRAVCATGGTGGGGGGGGGAPGGGGDGTGPVVGIGVPPGAGGGGGQPIKIVPTPGGGGPGKPVKIVGTGGGGQGAPGGGGEPCLGRDFRLEITARDKSGIRSVEVFVDGKSIERTTRKRFVVLIRAQRLPGGNHTIRVVAVDGLGNRTVRRAKFTRCSRAAFPTFTG